MPNIRTVNKHHKRAVAAQVVRTKAAEKALVQDAKPAKVALPD